MTANMREFLKFRVAILFLVMITLSKISFEVSFVMIWGAVSFSTDVLLRGRTWDESFKPMIGTMVGVSIGVILGLAFLS